MKKFLALVLALVMTMSLVTISAGAEDFADADSITYEEAVDVMTAIGVVGGYADGSFNPAAGLTRGAAAKIICNMILGPTTADALVANDAPFSDVAADNVFAGYIAYCVNEGIISGYADGTFKPAAPLTGYAFMKMLLGALGYDAAVEGYVGSNWSIAVAKRALNIGLDAGLVDDFSGAKALTREEACLYAFNALKAPVVNYGDKSTIKVGDIEISTSAEAQTTSNTGGYIVAGGTNDAKVNFCEEFFSKLELTVTADDFGRAANKWTYKNATVGTYAAEADYSLTGKVTKDQMYDLVGKTVVTDLADSTKTAATLTVIVDGQTIESATKTAANIAYYFADKNTASIGNTALTGNGSQVEVYVDSETNAVTVIVINTYLMQATEDYNAKKETLAAGLVGTVSVSLASGETPIAAEDFAAVADFKEDDYFFVTVAGTGASNKTIQSVEAAEIVSGVVSSYSNTLSVTIDGVKYSYAFAAPTATGHDKNVAYAIGEETKVVTDGEFIYYVDDVTVASDNYVYVEEMVNDSTFSSVKNWVAKAVFVDGTYETISLKSKFYDGTVIDTTNDNPGWYTYYENDGVYTLDPVTTAAASVTTDTNEGDKLIETGVVTVGIDRASGTAIKANAATVFVVIDADDDVTVYTGLSKIPTLAVKASPNNTALTASYVKATNTSFAKYVFIDAAAAAVDGATSDTGDFVYLLKYDSTNMDAEENIYFTYKAIVNGELTTINLDDSAFGSSQPVYHLYTDVEVNDAGYVKAMNLADSGDDYTERDLDDVTVTYEEGILTIGATDYVLADDCDITVINVAAALLDDAAQTYEVDQAVSANALANSVKDFTNVDGNTFAKVNDNGQLVALYFAITAVTTP